MFATLGKAGGAATADVEAIGRLTSLGLRSGIPIRDLIAQLRGISRDRAVGFGPNKVFFGTGCDRLGPTMHEAEKEGIQQDLL